MTTMILLHLFLVSLVKALVTALFTDFLINTLVSFLVDTGPDVTVVRRDIWDGAEGGEPDVWKGMERLVDASGNLMRVMGTSIRLGEGEFTHPVIVTNGGTPENGFYSSKWLHPGSSGRDK